MRFWHWASWILAGMCGLTLVILGAAQKQSVTRATIPSWVLLVLALVTIIAIVAAVFTTHVDCPACKEYAGNSYRGDLLSSRPLHMRKDGEPDRRYKNNPTIYTYELKARCKKCQHVWDRGTTTTT